LDATGQYGVGKCDGINFFAPPDLQVIPDARIADVSNLSSHRIIQPDHRRQWAARNASDAQFISALTSIVVRASPLQTRRRRAVPACGSVP